MNLLSKLREYHFEVYHFIILIIILILSHVLLSYLNMSSTDELLNKSMEIYKLETAERQSDFITSSIELFLQKYVEYPYTQNDIMQTTESIDYLIYQQLLQKNVEDFCLVFYSDSDVLILDSGGDILNYVVMGKFPPKRAKSKRAKVLEYFSKAKYSVFINEDIKTFVEDGKTFHVFVPFLIKGEVIGAVYQKITPDVEKMTSIISTSISYTGAWISAIILFSLLVIFILTNYVIDERDIAKSELFNQKEKQLTQLIEAQKEASFARRIYHAHHKAEKIIGFIKSDLIKINENNLLEFSKKVKRYANFIGRVIYDMKTYNPPVGVIRNQQFKTDINEVIKFLVQNVIKRTYINDDLSVIKCDLLNELPIQHINEYVVWEILEPLIQNCIIHNKDKEVTVNISTFSQDDGYYIEIKDNGKGFEPFLLEYDEQNIKKIFKEKISTKVENINTGYGCYIAFENCKRCGWKLDAVNYADGAKFLIKI
ncbi:MAG: hypothetical protein KKE09_17505 [Bacteroidetes bacterium]|nr:hypothetical protein [Bacteroidota bacterium]